MGSWGVSLERTVDVWIADRLKPFSLFIHNVFGDESCVDDIALIRGHTLRMSGTA